VNTLDTAVDANKLKQNEISDKCSNLKKSFDKTKEKLEQASARNEQLNSLEDLNATLEELKQFVVSSSHVVTSLQESKCKDVNQLLLKFKVSSST